jgi:uncharacterized protein (TIGR00255 family)
MIRSMTGFGAAEAELPGAPGTVVRAEVRTVNHRFLQVKVRQPGELAFLEPGIEERVKKKLARGVATVSVGLSRPRAFEEAAVDVELARAWRDQLARAARALDVEWEPDLDSLAALPGVIGGRVDDAAVRRGGRAVLAVVDRALAALVEMREHEGAHLESELRRQAAAMGRVRGQIERRVPAVVRQHQKALEGRVAELLDGRGSIAAGDLAREVALIADRLDVSEELARLAGHEAHLLKLLERGGSAGRKLDFLVQELHREANTIGSKASDAKLAHLVVELKTVIERLREQVQNIE